MASSSKSPKTSTSILSPAVLAQSPHLPAVVRLINYTYNEVHITSGFLPPDPTTRLQSQTQLPSELAPDGFTILMFSSEPAPDQDVEGLMTSKEEEDGPTLIATASAKPYVPTQLEKEQLEQKTHLLFKRPPSPHHYPAEQKAAGTDGTGEEEEEDEARWPKWEMLATVVHPTLQGRGLGSALLERAIAEIQSRASASSPSPRPMRHHHRDSTGDLVVVETAAKDEGKGKGKVMLMLSTLLETTESYYLKRGFVTTDVRRFGPGTMGSRDGFGVAEMMRWVDL